MEILIASIIQIESSGNDMARSKADTSAGPMGITLTCLTDVNRVAGTHYVPDDRFDRVKAVEMFRIYTAHYCTDYRTDRAVCMVWHYGPTAAFQMRHKQRKTDPDGYWRKVKTEMTKTGETK